MRALYAAKVFVSYDCFDLHGILRPSLSEVILKRESKSPVQKPDLNVACLGKQNWRLCKTACFWECIDKLLAITVTSTNYL